MSEYDDAFERGRRQAEAAAERVRARIDYSRKAWRLTVPPLVAADDKWRAGRVQYGHDPDAPHGTAWHGAHPLIECHDDLLDALKYADEAEAQGVHRAFVQPVRAAVLHALEAVREAYAEVGEE